MGIPHLITNLRPFADPNSLAGQHAVIDGPGLAYHVYFLCLAWQPRARNPFEAIPSASLIQQALLKWLDVLQANGVILFVSTLVFFHSETNKQS